METDRRLPSAQSIVAKNVHVRNVAGGYNDNSHNTTTNVKNIHISKSGRHEMKALLKHVAHGALHDSAERGPDAPKCHPETRIAVQKDIMGWIGHGEEDDAPKRILWLSGPAGSGKTAIAGTIADECYKKGLLAASFFFSAFSRSKNRRWKKPFIPTLLYGLLQHESIVGFKEEVLAVIIRDPMVFEKHLDQQLEKLLLAPLRKALGCSDYQKWPTIILVDGLDECQGDSEPDISQGVDDPAAGLNAQKEVLSALSHACADPAFPFRIIITSRPEPAIQHFFSTSPALALNIFLDDKYNPDTDIRFFLEAMFRDIRRRFNLPSTWAYKDVVELLVKEASGQFIYAATVLRFVDSPGLGSPQQQLIRVLEWRHLDDSKPFAPLDALYSCILRTSPNPLLAVKWLCAIVDQSGQGFKAPYIKGLLESYSGETEYVLGSLTSLVRLADTRGVPEFYFYHKSLLDFFLDPHRSSGLHVNEESLIHFMQDRYYQVLQARGLTGPLSMADPLTDPPSRTFPEQFCGWLNYYVDPCRRYTPVDVNWWLANLVERNHSVGIPKMFASIHGQCKWHYCLPGCCVWRKVILQYCTDHNWRLPTIKEMLQDRFKKFKYTVDSMQKYPLRIPSLASHTSEPIPLPPNRRQRTSRHPSKALAIRQAAKPPVSGRVQGTKQLERQTGHSQVST